MILASPVSTRLRLRDAGDARWQVQVATGTGRVLDFESDRMRLEVFLPPWSNKSGKSSATPGFDTAVQCRYGVIWTDEAASMWCLMGGVPLPSPTATRQEADLRLSIALARAPSPLTAILGPLASASLPPLVDRDSDGPPGADDIVEMMVRVTRDDVTVYARARALPALWLRLLSGMSSVADLRDNLQSDPRDHHLTPPLIDDAYSLSVPIHVASGRVAARVMRELSIGDVLRLPARFDTSGVGRLQLGDVEIGVRWLERSPWHVFEVLSTSPVIGSTFTTQHNAADRFRPLSEVVSMNINDPESASSDSAANEHIDELAYEDTLQSPTEEEARSAPPKRMSSSALDGLPVDVVAEIGTLTMTMGNLRAITPGMLIKLGARGMDEVVLRAVDGPPLAYAELVDIGGHLGMQITRIATR